MTPSQFSVNLHQEGVLYGYKENRVLKKSRSQKRLSRLNKTSVTADGFDDYIAHIYITHIYITYIETNVRDAFLPILKPRTQLRT